jgi:hypothetical protein
MDPIATIRENALSLLEKGDHDSVDKAAALLKAASDLEQQQASTAKLKIDYQKVEQDLQASSHHWKDTIAAATPLLTTLILGITLSYQMYSGHLSEKDKQADAARQAQQSEQTRWTEALKTMYGPNGTSSAASLLNTFTVEPQKTYARTAAAKLLLTVHDRNDFDGIFAALDPVVPADMDTLAQISRSIESQYYPLSLKFSASHNGGPPMAPNDLQALSDLGYEQASVSQKIAFLLKQRKSDNPPVNLSGAAIFQADFTGADLRNTDLSGTGFTSVNFDGCDLSNISKFQYLAVYFSAWWHAAKIDPQLLDYLAMRAPYAQGVLYPGAKGVTLDDYNSNVARLKSAAGH